MEMLNYKFSDGSVFIIHGGGTYGNKEETLDRWLKNYLSIPHKIRQYIALENDEFSYSVMDLLPFCEKNKIPFCLDIFHNSVSNDKVNLDRKLFIRIFNTWKIHGLTPKIHVSNQEPGKKRGAHSKTLNKIPKYLFLLPKIYKTNLDIMLEVKDKEQSVFKIYDKYFYPLVDEFGNIEYEYNGNIENYIKKNISKFT